MISKEYSVQIYYSLIIELNKKKKNKKGGNTSVHTYAKKIQFKQPNKIKNLGTLCVVCLSPIL